ncbi:MAG: YbgA family protein [bacterium]
MSTDKSPFFDPVPDENKLRLGISSCLMGQEVRWNAGHKRNRYLTDILGDYVDFVPVCPEDEVMGTPRDRVRLVGNPDEPQMVESESGHDWTKDMRKFVEEKVRQLEDEDLDGYVLKKNSPTCGMEKVMIFKENGDPVGEGQGLFARELMDQMSLLPVEEEGRLNDAGLRENFIERIFSYHRWKTMREESTDIHDLQQFHRDHKLTLMAHDQDKMRELGRIAAGNSDQEITDFNDRLDTYGQLFLDTLKGPSRRSNKVNVMQHVIGYLKDRITSEDKQELLNLIEQYRNETVPIIVPLTLIKHHFRKHPEDWILKQTFLNPYPSELMLRNHV